MPALKKAQKIGISCCMLFDNGRHEVPQLLRFENFVCKETIQFISNFLDMEMLSWHALMKSDAIDSPILSSVAALLASKLESQKPRPDNDPLKNLEAMARLKIDGYLITVFVIIGWKCFRSKSSTSRIEGSLSLTENSFIGNLTGPVIDRFGDHPGPGWEEIDCEQIQKTAGQKTVAYITAEFSESLILNIAEIIDASS